jgi:hypothetical protein
MYKNYFLFIIHFKVRIIELFWLVNFGNIIQSEHSLHILNEMIWFIDRPILLAPYFLIVQSEELLLLKPIIFTKKQHGAQRLKYKCVDITECKLYMRVGNTKITNRVGENRRTWPAE